LSQSSANESQNAKQVQVNMDYNKKIESQIDSLENFNEFSKRNNQKINDSHKEAKNYLLNHNWCDGILKSWLARSWDELFMIFLFRIESSMDEVDDYV